MILLKKISKFLIILLFASCSKENSTNTIEGLWIVKDVQISNNSSTPVARWIRFNNDGTQVSGNGWLQHSYGKWTVNDGKLSIVDENGIKDNASPFTYSIVKETMTWKRTEEGQVVIIAFKELIKFLNLMEIN